MSYAPPSLLQARTYLREQTGLPWVSLGIVGSTSTHFSGYHLGWDRIRQNQGRNDYSIRESRRDANPTDAAMALDIGNFKKGTHTLRSLSVWLVQQAREKAPGTNDIREIIYTPDGKTVRRWDRLGIRTGGDSSHLGHTHLSYFRDSEKRDKIGLFRRYFEGDDNDVELNDSVDMYDESGKKRWWAGQVIGQNQISVNSALQYGAMTPFYIRDEVLPKLGRLEASLKVLTGQDVVSAVREEFSNMISGLGQIIREEITEADEEQIERVFRRVLGSVDEA